MSKRRFFVFAAVLAIGCDPGWRYRPSADPPAQSDVVRYDAKGVDAKVSASLFSMGLDVEIDLTNRGIEPLSVDPQRLHVLDTRGRSLPRDERVRNPDSTLLNLATGETYRVRARFIVNPTRTFNLVRNSDLRTLLVVYEGLSRAGQPVPVQITLTWED